MTFYVGQRRPSGKWPVVRTVETVLSEHSSVTEAARAANEARSVHRRVSSEGGEN